MSFHSVFKNRVHPVFKNLLKLYLKFLNSDNAFNESGSVFHRRGPLYKKDRYIKKLIIILY